MESPLLNAVMMTTICSDKVMLLMITPVSLTRHPCVYAESARLDIRSTSDNGLVGADGKER